MTCTAASKIQLLRQENSRTLIYNRLDRAGYKSCAPTAGKTAEPAQTDQKQDTGSSQGLPQSGGEMGTSLGGRYYTSGLSLKPAKKQNNLHKQHILKYPLPRFIAGPTTVTRQRCSPLTPGRYSPPQTTAAQCIRSRSTGSSSTNP